MPKRIQRKRTKGWKKPEKTVYVGRGSRWGNPFIASKPVCQSSPCMGHIVEDVFSARDYVKYNPNKVVPNVEEAVRLYKEYILPDLIKTGAIDELFYKNLMCWCPLDKPCHADSLLDAIEKRVAEYESLRQFI